MKRRRTARPEAQASHDRWLVSYADFITLLFAFFVVLYASSQVDNRKMVRISAAIEGAFQDLGVSTSSASGGSSALKPHDAISVPATTAQVAVQATVPPHPPELAAKAPPEQTAAPSTSAIDTADLKKRLEEALGKEIKKKQIEMRVNPEGLVVSLREVGFFRSGDAELISDAKPTIARIAKILSEKGFEIRVEGHTDNVPIHTARFRSNWELSTARATEVVIMLVQDFGFDPHSVSVSGYAEFHPVAPNDTEDDRKMNRRVDLVVVGVRPPGGQRGLPTSDPPPLIPLHRPQ